MIGRLSGRIARKGVEAVLVDVGGVGYEVVCPLSVLDVLPREGEPGVLAIHTHVREDQIRLFGFVDEEPNIVGGRDRCDQAFAGREAAGVVLVGPFGVRSGYERTNYGSCCAFAGFGGVADEDSEESCWVLCRVGNEVWPGPYGIAEGDQEIY